MNIKSFEEMEVWQLSRVLVAKIYLLTSGNGFSKDYALKDQMRRCAVSVMSNIAEGFERHTNKEFVSFLFIAKGSCGEFRSQLYVALDCGYVAEGEFKESYELCNKISKSISGFIKYLSQRK